jgi:arabinofuranan 3-O-arabinosyltransferase
VNAGRPFRAAQCSAPVSLASGLARLQVLPGLLRVDHLRLASPAPAASAASGGGAVLDPGSIGRGRVTGTRLRVGGPSWLVLGQSFNRGWRAFCGDRSLGTPVPIDGYANGWPVRPGCSSVHFDFAPNRRAYWGYAISGLACLVLLGFVVLARRRRLAATRAGVVDVWTPDPVGADRPAGMPLLRAALIALVPALIVAFAFAARSGPIAWLLFTLVLWRGIGARALTIAAGALLLVVVPVLYLLFPGTDHGGFDTKFATEHLGASFVAVAAYVLLATAVWRVSTATRRSDSPPGGPAE